MANALVVRGQTAPLAQNVTRAAQYVRMSTDYQRYSIANQAAVIAAYAQIHGLTVVRTYRDDGESGLKLKNRAGLIELLDDAQSGQADFRHILVYDVSRWGRFQDTDESAHLRIHLQKSRHQGRLLRRAIRQQRHHVVEHSKKPEASHGG
jgi:DNA invertase Pin-like site-specific DNA recombinase